MGLSHPGSTGAGLAQPAHVPPSSVGVDRLAMPPSLGIHLGPASNQNLNQVVSGRGLWGPSHLWGLSWNVSCEPRGQFLSQGRRTSESGQAAGLRGCGSMGRPTDSPHCSNGSVWRPHHGLCSGSPCLEASCPSGGGKMRSSPSQGKRSPSPCRDVRGVRLAQQRRLAVCSGPLLPGAHARGVRVAGAGGEGSGGP